MAQNNYFIDIHLHPTLKAFANQTGLEVEFSVDENSYKKLTKLVQNQIRRLVEPSQANLAQFKKGNVRGGFFSLTPIERPFFEPRIKNIFLKLFLKDEHFLHLARCLTGYPYSTLRRIFNEIRTNSAVNYFQELREEYKFLSQQAFQTENKVVICQDYIHYRYLLEHEPHTIPCVLTIEGAHALGNYPNHRFFHTDPVKTRFFEKTLRKDFLKNVTEMKSWGNGTHAPLFITFCHHYWNLLAGHAKSLSPKKGLIPGTENIFNQKTGLDIGITNLGKEVLEALLSRENGRRILIDIKHMSWQSRKDYYTILEKKAQSGDRIPIICSHAAVNGLHSLEEALAYPDTWQTDKKTYFSRWSINLYDDEIRIIHQSGGLIGLMMHEGRNPGGKAKKAFGNSRRHLQRIETFAKTKLFPIRIIKYREQAKNKLRQLYFTLFMSNIFHIIRTINHPSAWDIICLGTDYDGLLDTYQSYNNLSTLKLLEEDMCLFLENPQPLTVYEKNKEIQLSVSEIKDLMFGYSSEDLVHRISHLNVEHFLEKNFVYGDR